jgi:hypothetical protein
MIIQIISAVFAGIVTVGILWKLFDIVFTRLEEKVSKDTWDEHCKRIDQLLDQGNAEFKATREALKEHGDVLAEIKRSITEIKTTLDIRKRENDRG